MRDKLSENFMLAFEADFAENGVDAIKSLREKSPEKYSEIAARLIAAIESRPDGFDNCTTMEQIGRKLLQSVGAVDVELTDDMIAEAVACNDAFIAKLEAIRDRAQGVTTETSGSSGQSLYEAATDPANQFAAHPFAKLNGN